MTNSTDIVDRLEIAAQWDDSPSQLLNEAADLIQSQQALIEEMREAGEVVLQMLINRVHEGDENLERAKSAILRLVKAHDLSQKE